MNCILSFTLFFLVLSCNVTLPVWAAQRSADDIVLGMSTALSGPTAELGRRMRDGVQIGLDRINREGGIRGRALQLRVYDDGYEPFRVAPNMRTLIEVDQVLAIIGNVGTPTAIAALPIAKANNTLFFAPFTGAGLLRKMPPERYVVNFRASYAQEISAMVDALIDQGGLDVDQIAFFTQRDGYGDAGYIGGVAALKRHGVKDDRRILHVRYERNTLAVENALADLLFSRNDIRAVIMVGAYAPCAKFIRLARQSGLDALFLNVSFVGSELLLRKLGKDGDGVLVTQVVPPLESAAVPIVREYLKDHKAFNPETVPDYVGLEGYVAARLLTLALSRIEGELTRESIVQALEGLGRFDLGLGAPLHLGPLQHQASQHVWVTRFDDGDIVPFQWAQIRSLLSQGGGR
ncbi:MAG: ABC transporter substrate-binding protein [Desulfuromonas sp.]|nr:ABC transporter substrate-binding protein [Desulfuromonas sp.]